LDNVIILFLSNNLKSGFRSQVELMSNLVLVIIGICYLISYSSNPKITRYFFIAAIILDATLVLKLRIYATNQLKSFRARSPFETIFRRSNASLTSHDMKSFFPIKKVTLVRSFFFWGGGLNSFRCLGKICHDYYLFCMLFINCKI